MQGGLEQTQSSRCVILSRKHAAAALLARPARRIRAALVPPIISVVPPRAESGDSVPNSQGSARGGTREIVGGARAVRRRRAQFSDPKAPQCKTSVLTWAPDLPCSGRSETESGIQIRCVRDATRQTGRCPPPLPSRKADSRAQRRGLSLHPALHFWGGGGGRATWFLTFTRNGDRSVPPRSNRKKQFAPV